MTSPSSIEEFAPIHTDTKVDYTGGKKLLPKLPRVLYILIIIVRKRERESLQWENRWNGRYKEK